MLTEIKSDANFMLITVDYESHLRWIRSNLENSAQDLGPKDALGTSEIHTHICMYNILNQDANDGKHGSSLAPPL